MALKRLLADLDIISKLGDNPGTENGLPSEELKRKFDEAVNIIKTYLNEYLVPELEKTVDVDALLKGILDDKMSSPDKAAQAKAVGRLLNLRRMDVGKVLEKSFAGGDFAVPSPPNFGAQLSDDGTVTVKGGVCIMQGNLIELPDDYSVTLNFDAGIGGTYRSDLICLRVSTDYNGYYSAENVLIGGHESYTEYVDPEYQQGDINSTSATRDFPLYRLKMDGVSASIEPLFMVGNRVTVTLPASGWIGESAPFTQTVTAVGLVDGRRVMTYPSYGDDIDKNLAMQEACACISYIKREGQNATFTCLEDKPAVDINVILEAYA